MFKLHGLTIHKEENKKINWFSSMEKKVNPCMIVTGRFLFKTAVIESFKKLCVILAKQTDKNPRTACQFLPMES